MSIVMAYITVILVWTTTPLGVAWSSETINPTVAALMRMSIAALLGWLALRAMDKKLCWSFSAIKKYLAANIGITGAMYATYQAALLIPSGLISVIYGLSPMLSAVLARYVLNESSLSYSKMGAFFIALIGLGFIFEIGSIEVSELNVGMVRGISYLLIAVTLFSLSGVLVKKSSFKSGHFEQTVGALIFSVPLYTVALVFELMISPIGLRQGAESLGIQTLSASNSSLFSIIYLAIMGSLVGFVCYFYILAEMSPSTVALTTLVTPVLALMMGATLNGETVSMNVWLGTGLILGALILFNWGSQAFELLKPMVLTRSRFQYERDMKGRHQKIYKVMD